MNPTSFGLYDPARESSDCGVGFITRLDGTPHHDVIRKGDEALCAIPTAAASPPRVSVTAPA
ncbi:hypothetical protein [Curtobacterium sp. 24E2]